MTIEAERGASRPQLTFRNRRFAGACLHKTILGQRDGHDETAIHSEPRDFVRLYVQSVSTDLIAKPQKLSGISTEDIPLLVIGQKRGGCSADRGQSILVVHTFGQID